MKASVRPEAQQPEEIGLYPVEGEEPEVEERPEKRQRVEGEEGQQGAAAGEEPGEDEEEEMLRKSGVFEEEGGRGDSRGSRDVEEGKRGRSNGQGRGVVEPEEEGRPVRTAAPPSLPTAQERREHNATHHPPRSWCRYCVEGRGIASAHARCDEERVGDIGELHFDYCFLTNKVGSESATTIVGFDKYTQGVLAHVVPEKRNRIPMGCETIG